MRSSPIGDNAAVSAHPSIRQIGDPILRTPATPVTRFDQKLAAQIDRMFAIMAEAEGAGLAANQIGLSNALFVYDCDGHQGVVANPVVTVLDDTEVVQGEGCLSVAGHGYECARPKVVRLNGLDADGSPIAIEAEGYLARCFQHESDHLVGKLFLDRLPREVRRVALQRVATPA